MPIEITMPALSPTMEEGTLAKWLVKEGDTVAPGDVIAEIETDKATMEVEAVDEGRVAKLVVPAGTENVKVNAVIAILAGEGEDAGQAAAPPAAAPKSDAPAAAAPQPTAARTEAPAASGESKESKSGTVNGARPSEGERVFASPLARRLARERGIDLAGLSGSGPHGRIVMRDLEGATARKPAPPAERPSASSTPAAPPASAPASAPAPSAPSDTQILKLFEEGSYELVRHDNMRKTIARRLVEAKTTVPHFYLTLDCRLDALLALRAELNAAAPSRKTDKGDLPAYKLSVNDMVIKALALALQAVPDANVSWTSEAMVRHRHSDVGVAVSIPGGLITPIIRKAETKSLSAISNEMKDLAKRARDRKLKPEEYQGGTTAVSNLGMFGIKDFSAVINPPHATIVAVGAGEERVVATKGAIEVVQAMSVTLSTDHRAVDGALGAELLTAFRGYIEKPMSMLV